MEQEENKKEIRNISLPNILAWIFGIIFLIAGAMGLASSVIGGVLIIIASVIILPPANNFVRSKLRINMSKGIRIFIAVVLIGVAISFMPNNSERDTDVTADQMSTENVSEETSSKDYQKVFEFSGNGAKKSEPFVITGDRFKIKYNCTGDLCSASLYKIGNSFPSDLIMNTTDSVNDETIIYGSGEYYINVNSIGTYSMIVEDYR